MADLDRSSAVLELGKRLVLQIKDDGDIAASWLSHLLAERLAAVEAASNPEARAEAEARCTTLVLELWREQAHFRNGFRPFEALEPLLQTLESLQSDRHPFRYYSRVLKTADGADVPDAVNQWLEFARGVDDMARQLIRIGLRRAVAGMGSEIQDWVELAREAAAEDPPEAVIVRIVSKEERDQYDGDRAARTRQLERLTSFISLCQALAADLAVEIDADGEKDRSKPQELGGS